MRRAARLLGTIAVGGAVTLGTASLLAPAAQAAPVAARAARSPVVIQKIYYNSPGSDHGSNSSLNHEWVLLHNRTNHAVTMTHWTLRDRAGHVFKFARYRLWAHSSVKIHTGSGRRSQTNRYWDSGWYIWNNNGDGATLKNAHGAVKSRCSYSDPSENFASHVC
jgi:hypothetical protein